MSDRKMFGKAEDLSVFAIPEGRSRGKQRVLSANIKLWSKKIHDVHEAERAFELQYFGPRPAVIKLIVQGGNTDK